MKIVFGFILSLVLVSSGNFFVNYPMVLAVDTYDKCPEAMMIYKDLISNINSGTESRFKNKVSEDVAHFITTSPVSEKVGEVNKSVDYLIQNCHFTESGLKRFADYNQNIYDSLDLYKGTTPRAIPEFGSIVMLILVVSVVGVIISARKIRF